MDRQLHHRPEKHKRSYVVSKAQFAFHRKYAGPTKYCQITDFDHYHATTKVGFCASLINLIQDFNSNFNSNFRKSPSFSNRGILRPDLKGKKCNSRKKSKVQATIKAELRL